jgi:Zn-dependent protease with chaperone function
VSFLVLFLALVLAAHLLLSSLVAAAVSLTCRIAGGAIARLEPPRRASVLFALILLPSLAGLLGATLLVAPAWLLYEPQGVAETMGPVLAACASAGGLLLVVRIVGAARAVAQARRLLARFRRDGCALPGLPLPALRAPHPFPVAALAGVTRPRLLFAETVLRALDPDELRAVVAHELAHHAAADNLKRLAIDLSPDLLAFTPCGRRLREEFLEAAEALADRRACDRVAPTVLARALLKVAALVPAGGRLELAMASLHRERSLASRVRDLLAAADAGVDHGSRDSSRSAARVGLVVAGAASTLLLLPSAGAALAPLLRGVHGILERAVHLLA